MSGVKKIPHKEIIEHLKDDGNGFLIVTDTKKIRDENSLEKVRSFGTESEKEFNDFTDKIKSLSERLNVSVKTKVIIIYNENKGE